MIKRLLLLAAVGVGVAVGTVALEQDTGPWLEVERRDLVVRVDIEGELEATESVTIGPPTVPRTWNFKISSLAMDGQHVQAGQPVVGFDTTQLRRQLEQLSSQRDTAAAELEKVQADLRKEESDLRLRLSEAEAKLRKAEFALDVPAEVTARRDLEKARIDRRIAESEIGHLENDLEHLERRRTDKVEQLTSTRDLAGSKVEELQAAIRSMTVVAPKAGTVVLRADWRGDKPKVGDQTWRGRTVLEIPDLERLRAKVDIAEADIGRVRPGQQVTLRLDAYPDIEYRATVERIRTAVQPRSRNDRRKIVKAQLQLEQTDRERMRPGMRLRGHIEVERIESRVAVPQDAVFQDAGGSYVMVQGLLGDERREPQLGERDDRFFEVLEGLEAGDRVLGREAGP